MMYNIACQGHNKETAVLFQEKLPDSVKLIFLPEKSILSEYVRNHPVLAVVLSFENRLPTPKDLVALKTLVGLPHVPAIIVVAPKITPSQAICVMKNGAYDCLCGAVSGEALGLVINRLIKENTPKTREGDLLLGEGATMCALKDKLYQYAKIDHSVLINGETGSGKELAAKTLHQRSPRKDAPFVPINCAMFSDELLGAELFGTCSGAFTGATNRAGIIEMAHKGSLFLDEIGDLSLAAQAKLLRFTEDRILQRMGSNKKKHIDVRIIGASNCDLKKRMQEGAFRSDLFYRLNLLKITMPSLREHAEDIPVLVRFFLKRAVSEYKDIDNAAMKTLVEYDWPGNVRELQSVLIRSALKANGHMIRTCDLVFE